MTKTNAEEPKKIRGAIYTRRSTEEGLAQEFNSLDAHPTSHVANTSVDAAGPNLQATLLNLPRETTGRSQIHEK